MGGVEEEGKPADGAESIRWAKLGPGVWSVHIVGECWEEASVALQVDRVLVGESVGGHADCEDRVGGLSGLVTIHGMEQEERS